MTHVNATREGSMAGRYEDQRTIRAQKERTDRLEKRVKELEGTIRAHHRRCHAGDWGYDDELWSAIGLIADPEVLG
jgi:hypothetical protein